MGITLPVRNTASDPGWGSLGLDKYVSGRGIDRCITLHEIAEHDL